MIIIICRVLKDYVCYQSELPLAEEFRMSFLSVKLVMHRVCFGLSLLSAELSLNLFNTQSFSRQSVPRLYKHVKKKRITEALS